LYDVSGTEKKKRTGWLAGGEHDGRRMVFFGRGRHTSEGSNLPAQREEKEFEKKKRLGRRKKIRNAYCIVGRGKR